MDVEHLAAVGLHADSQAAIGGEENVHGHHIVLLLIRHHHQARVAQRV